MARRKDHSPEELSDWVIRSVVDVLQQEPASSLSLRKVAKMVGYSPGTLINLFGSYAHLILAVNAHTLDDITERLSTRLQSAQNLDEQQQLLQFAFEYHLFAQQHPHQWRVLFEHRLEDDMPQWQQDRINQLFDLIESRLMTLAPNSSADELHIASRSIWASVHGICMLELDDKLFSQNAISGQRMIESVINHYLTSWLNANLAKINGRNNNSTINNKNSTGV